VRKLIHQSLTQLGRRSREKSRIYSAGCKIDQALALFGNAHLDTTQAVSSSRFLLYQEFQFSTDGNLVGVKTLDYGLEKERVTHVPAGESNFDIFYRFLASATKEEKTLWSLEEPKDYHYLSSSHIPCAKEDEPNIRDLLKSAGISIKLQAHIFKLLSALLHLGNITFHKEQDLDSCSVKNRDLLETIAELLGVTSSNLEFCLTYQSKIVQNELCTLFLNAKESVRYLF
jgi:chitin synthase